jgi:type IV secretion system protein VirD4
MSGFGGNEARRIPPPPKNRVQRERAIVFCLLVGFCWSAAVTTQFVASRFGFSRELGPAILELAPRITRELYGAAMALCLGAAIAAWRHRWLTPIFGLLGVSLAMVAAGPVYAPFRVFEWYAEYRRSPGSAPVFALAWIVFASAVALAVWMIHEVAMRSRAFRTPVSHGSATWGRGDELRDERGLLLGRDTRGGLLRYGGEGHLLTVAPTRSGKGRGCVIPNLLAYTGSVVVSDVKGELYAVTHRQRETGLGQRVFALDPFGVTDAPSACFNPLDIIEPASDTAVDDARMIADMLVVTDRTGADAAFWDEEARGLLVGLILYVTAWTDCQSHTIAGDTAASEPTSGLAPDQDDALPPPRSLVGVREVLTAGPRDFQQHLERMALWRDWAHGLVARAADRLMQKAERERSGVISCAQNHTHFLDSPRIAAILNTSTVPLADLKRGSVSVYVVLPYERLDGYARWVRLMIGCSLVVVARDRGRARERVLFLLDEFDALGPLAVVQRAIALTGGFGAAFWVFLQDLAQLKGTYPAKWGTFLANADVLQCFGINDLETAEHVSRLVGDTTIVVASENESASVSRGRTAGRQEGSSVSTSETARRLILPNEVRLLPRDRQLLIVKGSPPILAYRLDYLGDREFAGQSDQNPLYRPMLTAGAVDAM